MASEWSPDPLVLPATRAGEAVAARPALADADPSTAVTVLFHLHARRLVGLARLLVDDLEQAEDLVQEAYLSLYRAWPRLRDPQAAVPYLQAAVVNGGRSVQRRRYTRLLHPVLPLPDAPAADELAELHGERDRVLALVRRLPPRQRQVLVLRYYLDQDEREIAEVLGISRGSVKQHASRGLRALREGLEEAER
jgi:RNA polymerase sigma-70 factor (sigma-E family)